MLARLLRRILLVELVVYLTAGSAVNAATGIGPMPLFLAALGLALAIRASIVAILFAVAWSQRDPQPVGTRPSLAGRAGIIVGEYLSVLLLYTVFQPFPRLAEYRKPHGPTTLPPVVLIHGYFCNRGFWWYLRRGLARGGAGLCEAVDLEPPFGDIDEYTPLLRQAIERLLARSRHPRVVLLCHSMGGLAARSLLAADPALADRVETVITLGTPHHGTVLARLGHGINAREMRPGSSWLQRLNRRPVPVDVRRVSIYSHFDDIVAPQSSARLDGWRNVGLNGPGHLAMTFSPTILRHVLGEIRAGMKREPTG